jgi:hypothetical protein
MPGRQQIVARELAEKLRLEKAFRREINSIFRRMVKDFAVTLAGTGTIPSASKFLADWESTLNKHYERVQRSFSGEVLEQQEKCNQDWYERKQAEDDEETEAGRAAIFALALQQWRDEHAGRGAQLITQTNQRDFDDALRQAREIVRDQDLPTDNRTLAATAVAVLTRKFQGRTPGILMLETQQSAESTKLIEANVLDDLPPFPRSRFGIGDTQAIKTWWTVGDDVVRDIHQAADDQKKKSTSPSRLAANYLCTLAILLWGHLYRILRVVGVLPSMNYKEIKSYGY